MYLVNFSTLSILLLLTTFLGCSIGQTTLSPRTAQKKTSSGWLQSEVGDKKNSDIYYFKVNVASNPNYTNGAKKEFSCKSAALEEGKNQAPTKLFEEINTNQPLVHHDVNFAIKEVKAKDCKATGRFDSSSPFSEWSQCECVITVKLENNQKNNFLAKSHL